MINLKETYGHKYRVRDDGTDDSDRKERVWCQEIPGKYGNIYPYGHNGTLAVMCDHPKISTRIESLGLQVVQRGEAETVFLFKPEQIEQIAILVQSRKKKVFSQEAKDRATNRLKMARQLGN